jgi:formate/nitrite transporter FocA (FNT family)
MSPQRERYYRVVFLLAAVYDLVLGTIFTFFHTWAFELLDIADEDPGSGYVPLIGAFLFVIGVAYFLIYRGDLVRNVDLIAVGTLYKLAYSAIAFWFWIVIDDVPHILFPALFGVVDLLMFVAMAECWLTVRRISAGREAAAARG